MIRALFDINIVLDVLLDRRSHSDVSGAALALVESGAAEGLMAAHAFPTVYYFVRKVKGHSIAHRAVSGLLRTFHVAAINTAALHEALCLSCQDYEDALTASAARLAACDCIVTRDPTGFRASPVLPVSPEVFVTMVNTDTGRQTI